MIVNLERICDEESASQILSKFTIIHPYGLVAPLRVADQREGVPFGETNPNEGLFALAENIKTYTEQITDQAAIYKIKDELDLACCIVFLGFGFHEPNMQLLQPPERM